MSDKQGGSYWARLARQMHEERLRERAEASQDRADQPQSETKEPAPDVREKPGSRRQGLRP
ncbi:MAG: hypothetical protein ACREFY_17870 [Acetobacteraceae bacterium]